MYRKHKIQNKRLYRIWHNMNFRCSNKKDRKWEYYGGKGIKVCAEWIDDFDNFAIWSLNNGYEDNLTIDRIDSNGNYEPSNCRWITLQNNIRRTAYEPDKKILCIETGKIYTTATEAAKDVGLKHGNSILYVLKNPTYHNCPELLCKAGGYTWKWI